MSKNQKVNIQDPFSGEIVVSGRRVVREIKNDGYQLTGKVTVNGKEYMVSKSHGTREWYGSAYEVK